MVVAVLRCGPQDPADLAVLVDRLPALAVAERWKVNDILAVLLAEQPLSAALLDKVVTSLGGPDDYGALTDLPAGLVDDLYTARTSTDADVLAALADHPDWRVSRAVACNPHTGVEATLVAAAACRQPGPLDARYRDPQVGAALAAAFVWHNLPDDVDDTVLAAALANPANAGWGGLVNKAFKAGRLHSELVGAVSWKEACSAVSDGRPLGAYLSRWLLAELGDVPYELVSEIVEDFAGTLAEVVALVRSVAT